MSFVRSLARLRQKPQSKQPEWLLVGLGNPGAQYAKTRHNIGFMCLNRLAHRVGARFRSSARDRADVVETSVAGVPAMLAQPQTYMNDSGVAVSRMVKRLRIDPTRVLLIYDDVDLPFSSVRIRAEGSSGGHRGVQSVIDSLQTSELPRVRVGIGRGGAGTKEYVLTEFSADERRRLPAICDLVSDIVETIVTDGVVGAMNRYNSQASRDATAS
jgi:PTH1 family peptidyl-tRNA hydrolase